MDEVGALWRDRTGDATADLFAEALTEDPEAEDRPALGALWLRGTPEVFQQPDDAR